MEHLSYARHREEGWQVTLLMLVIPLGSAGLHPGFFSHIGMGISIGRLHFSQLGMGTDIQIKKNLIRGPLGRISQAVILQPLPRGD